MAKYDSSYDTPSAHALEWAMHLVRLAIHWLVLERVHLLEIRTRSGRTMTNVDNGNLTGKQNCSYCVHYAADNSAGHCQTKLVLCSVALAEHRTGHSRRTTQWHVTTFYTCTPLHSQNRTKAVVTNLQKHPDKSKIIIVIKPNDQR